MNQEPVLVVLAAGMGSRYGGLKQIDAVGCQGEAILDFSLYDAWRAGFRTAVIIIKKAIEADFMRYVGARLEECPLEIRYAYQELDSLVPPAFQIPPERTKPWGTTHAVLCAREQIGSAPFAVVNADDYYGQSAFEVIYRQLKQAQDGPLYDYCMVGYLLGNTVTEHGSVARGICRVDSQGYLAEVQERTRIEKYPGGIHFTEDGDHWTDVPADTTVSMNMWGFTPSFLEEAARRFPQFLLSAENPAKAEYFLPLAVENLLQEGKARVKVLRSEDRWFGVTYAADKPLVIQALAELTAQGKYPRGLWTR